MRGAVRLGIYAVLAGKGLAWLFLAGAIATQTVWDFLAATAA